MTDPFSVTAQDLGDPFAVATSEFIEPSDIDGRLLFFIPESKGQALGANGPYDFVTGDMLVLSGDTTDKIDMSKGPFEVVGQRISCGMINQIMPHLRTKKMVFGRVNSQPSRQNRQVMAYRLIEPTPEEVTKARPIATAWLERRAKATDPFS
jgi:hypothetical protein